MVIEECDYQRGEVTKINAKDINRYHIILCWCTDLGCLLQLFFINYTYYIYVKHIVDQYNVF